jgi:hypothetical protein
METYFIMSLGGVACQQNFFTAPEIKYPQGYTTYFFQHEPEKI